MGKHPTNARKNRFKKIKASYAKAREDAQLAGVIPTQPVGAVRNEVVPPGADPPQIGLIGQALRNGWAVPEERKPLLVDELIKIIDDPEAPSKTKVAAFNALRLADQQQYERDHPEEAAKLKGGMSVSINNTNTSTTVFSDIEALEKSYERVINDNDEGDSEADGDVRQDSTSQSMDEEEPSDSEEKPEAD